jgi:hypothetical protein
MEIPGLGTFADIGGPSQDLNAVERAMSSVGLSTPLSRFGGGAVGTTLLLFTLKPSFAFENGVARPWAVWSSFDDSGVAPTMVPWWLAAILAGTVVGTVL